MHKSSNSPSCLRLTSGFWKSTFSLPLRLRKSPITFCQSPDNGALTNHGNVGNRNVLRRESESFKSETSYDNIKRWNCNEIFLITLFSKGYWKCYLRLKEKSPGRVLSLNTITNSLFNNFPALGNILTRFRIIRGFEMLCFFCKKYGVIST